MRLGSERREVDAGEVGGDVGGEIACGVVDLVEDLLLAGVHGERAAGSIELGEDGFAGFLDFREGKSEAGEIGNVFDAGIGEVSAGELAGALEEVAHRGSPGETIPVLERPAELVHDRCEEERRVGDAAGEDDIGLLAQALEQRFDAEVGIGGDDGFARIEGEGCGEAGGNAVEDIVPFDPGDAQAGETEAAGDGGGLRGGGARIGRAHIGDDAGAIPCAVRQDCFHALGEQGIEAGAAAAMAGQLGQSDGSLGEAFKDEVIEASVASEIHGGTDAIARETCSDSDAQCLHHHAGLKVESPLTARLQGS